MSTIIDYERGITRGNATQLPDTAVVEEMVAATMAGHSAEQDLSPGVMDATEAALREALRDATRRSPWHELAGAAIRTS